MLKDFKGWINRRSPAQIITAYYFLSISISVGLLYLPGVNQKGVEVSFIDTVFTAVTAVSVTGLTVVDLSQTYSVFGYFVIMIIMQFGGIGIMALGTFFWMLLGKKIGLKSRKLIMVDHNQYALSGLVQLVKEIIKLMILIEVIGMFILGFHFLKYYPTWDEAFLHGIFASVSATTNGGLDITGSSMIPYAHDYFVQFITIILISLGAIGFPVLIEVKAFLLKRKWENSLPYRFSLFTKVTTVTYAFYSFLEPLLF